jgi:hypothetical protein
LCSSQAPALLARSFFLSFFTAPGDDGVKVSQPTPTSKKKEKTSTYLRISTCTSASTSQTSYYATMSQGDNNQFHQQTNATDTGFLTTTVQQMNSDTATEDQCDQHQHQQQREYQNQLHHQMQMQMQMQMHMQMQMQMQNFSTPPPRHRQSQPESTEPATTNESSAMAVSSIVAVVDCAVLSIFLRFFFPGD